MSRYEKQGVLGEYPTHCCAYLESDVLWMTNELIMQETALEFHENGTLNAIIDLHKSEIKP